MTTTETIEPCIDGHMPGTRDGVATGQCDRCTVGVDPITDYGEVVVFAADTMAPDWPIMVSLFGHHMRACTGPHSGGIFEYYIPRDSVLGAGEVAEVLGNGLLAVEFDVVEVIR